MEAEIPADPTTTTVALTALEPVSVGAIFSAVGAATADSVSYRS